MSKRIVVLWLLLLAPWALADKPPKTAYYP